MSTNIIKRKKVLAYIDTHWSIGRIFKDLHPYLCDEFEIVYYDWSVHSPNDVLSLLDEFDIFITNLVNIRFFVNAPQHQLKKMIFCCHGSSEIDRAFSFPEGPVYSIVSKSIISLFPEKMKEKLCHSYNGVSLSNFNHIKRDGKLMKAGWCGKTHISCKRSFWCNEICNKSGLSLSIAENLSYDEVKEWYNTIDVLLINSGPNYWEETGPLPVFEAIASGILVIGVAVGNFAEIPGPKYSTIEEAIEIMNELKCDNEKVKHITEEQYQCVKNNWTYETLSKQWREVYNKI